MKRYVSPFLISVSLIALVSGNVQAQIAYDATKKAYFITGGATFNTDISGNDVFVGKDNAASFNTVGGITLTVNAGAKVTQFGNLYPDNVFYAGMNVFGENLLNVNGGSLRNIYLHDHSTLEMTGGTAAEVQGNGTSNTYITGGSLDGAYAFADSRVTLSAGTVTTAAAVDRGILNLNGTTVTTANGSGTGTLNVNTGLVTNVNGYNSSTVNFSGGSIKTVKGYANSALNVYAGTLSTTTLYDNSTMNVYVGSLTEINSYGSSTVNITGGDIARPWSYGTSTVNINGGAITSVAAFESSKVKISGGTTNDLYADSNSTVRLAAGAVQGLSRFNDNGAFFMSGGSMESFIMHDSATVTIAGGLIQGRGGFTGIYVTGGTLTLYGSGFTRTNIVPDNFAGFNGTNSTFTGTLLDGTALSTTLFLANGQTFANLGGGSQDNPLMPNANNNGVFVFNNVPSGAWFDPPIVDSFLFTMTDENFFTGILDFPTGFDTAFEVWVGNQLLGAFSSGQTLEFADFGFAGGVDSFTVSNITPGVDAEDPTGFPIKLAFSAGFASFTMRGVTGNAAAAPEPGTLILLVMGGAMALGACRVGKRR